MLIKYVSAVVAVALMIAYLLPVVVKLKDVALGVVILIGIAMMFVDLVESLRDREQ